MAGLTINDFRGAMGKYNLGFLKLDGEGDNQKIALYNNHRILRNNATNTAENNQAIRQQFAAAIETYLRSKGFDTAQGSAAGAFMDEIRKELLGDNVKTNALSRSADVARILDKLDAAVEMNDFTMSRTAGSSKLSERFLFTSNLGRVLANTFHINTKAKAESIAAQTLKFVRDSLELSEDGQLVLDGKMLKMAAKQANISTTRATTYLSTRQESILVKAQKFLLETIGSMKPSEMNDLVTGVGKKNLADLAIAKAVEDIHIDTVSARGLSTLSGVRRLGSNMMLGLDAFDTRRLADRNELNGLLSTLSKLASGQVSEGKIVLLGQEMTLSKQPNGNLTGQIGNVRFEAFGSAKVMIRNIENAIVNGSLPKNALHGIFANQDYTGANGDKAESFRRVKILSMAIIKEASKLGEIEMQILSRKDLKTVAEGIVNGTLNSPNAIKGKVSDLASKRMYSEETLEMVNTYLAAPDQIKNTAIINEPRTDTAPAVNKFVSDLFANAEVWKIDTLSEDPGSRLQDVFLTHKETLVALITGDLKTDSLPQLAGVDVKSLVDVIVAKLKAGGVTDAASLEAFVKADAAVFVALEDQINSAAKEAIGKVQTAFSEKMSAAGDAPKADTREIWEKSLGEIIDEQKQSVESVEGQFIRKLMNEYLARSSDNEKRSMMASLMNLTTNDSTEVQKFAAILKGAGPVFQKLMQGFPEDQIPASMRGVFADMKSHLAPIPDVVVKATLAKIVSDSEGNIRSISLDKTLGSASVGQAFLCTVTNKDGSTKQAVIKMLKPDIQNRFTREVDLLRQIAGEVGYGMSKTLEGRLSTIRDELNFNVESENIKGGQIYNKGGMVKSVELYKGVASGMNVLMLTKANGETIDTYITDKVDAKLKEIRGGLKFKAGKYGFRDTYRADNFGALQQCHRELIKLATDIARKQELLLELSKRWFDDAAFGSGYFHGDMHAGNIMVTDNDITLIDFGNAKKLTGVELKCLKQLICAAGAGDVDKFLESMDRLLGDSDGGVRLKDAEMRQKIRNFLSEVFNQGGLSETAEKMFIALNAIQNMGIEIPSAVYNYSSSQNRLKNSVTELGAKLDEVKLMLEQTVLEGSKVFTEHGATLPIYARAFVELLPALNEVKNCGIDGFTAGSRKSVIISKNDLTAENRAKLVESILAKPEKIKTVLEPAIELVSQIGLTDKTLEARLTSAREALAAANTDDARRTAVATMVEVLHDIQLQFINDFEKEQALPRGKTLGEAFTEVIRDRVENISSGILGPARALKFCSDIGGMSIAVKLYEKLENNQNRPKAEKILDEGRYYTNESMIDLDGMFGSFPEYKKHAQEFRFSADITGKLQDLEFSFGKNESARRELARQLGKNIMTIYRGMVCKGKSPLMVARAKAQTTSMKKAVDLSQLTVDKLKNAGSIPEFEFEFAYIATYHNKVEQPGIFQTFGMELDESGALTKTFGAELLSALKLTDADVDEIVESQFAAQRELWLTDDKTLTDDQIRDKMREQVKNDFELESQALSHTMTECLMFSAKVVEMR